MIEGNLLAKLEPDLFQLAQLGYQDLALYDASMGEWARDPTLPIETG